MFVLFSICLLLFIRFFFKQNKMKCEHVGRKKVGTTKQNKKQQQTKQKHNKQLTHKNKN